MKNWIRRCLRLLLLAVFLVSSALLLRQFFHNSHSSESYDNALQLALSTGSSPEKPESRQETEPTAPQVQWVPAPVEDDDPNMEAMAQINLAALREVNEDVVGWIMIPDTRIQYPIMQGEDNDFYLKHTWEGEENFAGSVFMEYRNTPDFTDYNTILYAHNMTNGSMFADLKRYSTQQFWAKHPYVYLVSDAGVYRYEVFSSYKADIDGSTYGLSFQQEKTRTNFLLDALKNSRIDMAVIPEMQDRVLTLSTCSGMDYDTRWVVHARLKMVQVQEQ